MTTLYKRELILCHKCKGEGILVDNEHRGPLSKQEILFCTNCNGYGREYMVTNITFEPFKK